MILFMFVIGVMCGLYGAFHRDRYSHRAICWLCLGIGLIVLGPVILML